MKYNALVVPRWISDQPLRVGGPRSTLQPRSPYLHVTRTPHDLQLPNGLNNSTPLFMLLLSTLECLIIYIESKHQSTSISLLGVHKMMVTGSVVRVSTHPWRRRRFIGSPRLYRRFSVYPLSPLPRAFTSSVSGLQLH